MKEDNQGAGVEVLANGQLWLQQALLQLHNCRDLLSKAIDRRALEAGNLDPQALKSIHCLLKVMQMEQQLLVRLELFTETSHSTGPVLAEDLAILERFRLGRVGM